MVMALMADAKTARGFQSQTTLASAMGCSVRHVGDLVRGLEANTDAPVGVRRTRRGSATGRSSDQYELFFRQPAQHADSDSQPEQAPCADSEAVQPAQHADSPPEPTGTPEQPNRQITTPETAHSADDQLSISSLSTITSVPAEQKRGKARSKAPPKDPVPGAHDLKLHYVAEFKRTRDAEPNFGKGWGRAVKAFGELVATHGLERSKGIVTQALSDQYTRRINPWELVDDANKHIAPGGKRGGAQVQRGGTIREGDPSWIDSDLEGWQVG